MVKEATQHNLGSNPDQQTREPGAFEGCLQAGLKGEGRTGGTGITALPLLWSEERESRDHLALHTAAATHGVTGVTAQPNQPWPAPALSPRPTWHWVWGQSRPRGRGN